MKRKGLNKILLNLILYRDSSYKNAIINIFIFVLSDIIHINEIKIIRSYYD